MAGLTGLQIRTNVQEELFRHVDRCIACGKTPAPRGLHRTDVLARWASERAEATGAGPADEARRQALAMAEDDRCAACYSQLEPVVGIPDGLLSRVLNRVRGARRMHIRGFLETRFVFLMCRECRESSNEEHISADDIRMHYDRLRAALNDADLLPAGATQIADDIILLVAEAIRARDAA